MVTFRMICPECRATVITSTRLSAVLELCPSCGHHIWDLYDALLADIYSPGMDAAAGQRAQA